MFSIPFGPWRKAEPTNEDRAVLARIETVLQHVPQRGVIDPLNIARQVRVDGLAAVGYLRMLVAQGVGQFVVRVVTDAGEELARFPTVHDVPGRFETEFGEEFEVQPANIDITFDPHFRGPSSAGPTTAAGR